VLTAKVTAPDEVPMFTIAKSNVLPTVALGTAVSIAVPSGNVYVAAEVPGLATNIWLTI
jgi:hypothetical protein